MGQWFSSFRWWVLGLALLAGMPGPGLPPAAAADAAVPFDPKGWRWRNEEHWAVDQMARDIVEMALAAGGRDPGQARVDVRPLEAGGYQVAATGPGLGAGLHVRVDLESHLWHPGSFRPLARTLAGQLGLKPGGASPVPVLEPLLRPDPGRLDPVQAALSRSLTRDPASPALHEQAAFTLGVLGLFDRSVAFEDHRALLGRMAAHLALAEALCTGEPGAEGRLAGTALLILAGRKAEAAAALAAPGTGGLPAPWRTALTVLATEDWRPVQNPRAASLAEVLAAFRVRSAHQGADPAAEWILASGRTDLPMGTIARVTLSGNHYSVANGHRLTAEALPADLREIGSLLAARGRAGGGDAGLCAALSAHPGTCWDPESRTLQVVGWGLWAQRCQAILLCDMMQAISFLDQHYGSREATRAYLDRIEAAYGRLEQFPVLQKRYANLRPPVYRPAMEKAVRLVQAHPEVLSDCSLVCLHQPPPDQTVPPGLPRYQDWLAVPEPFGTAYNWSARTWEMAEVRTLPLDAMTRYLALDPANMFLVGDYLACRYPRGGYRAEGVEAACAAIKAFDRLGYLWRLLPTFPDHDPGTLPILRELADLDPAWMGRLGDQLARQGRPDEASTVYQAFFKRCPDRVAASNGMVWEVLYLHGRGEAARAEAIAAECAGVYSATGLKTLALLREAQGRYPEAERLYQAILERYDDSFSLDAFHCRTAGRWPESAQAWARRQPRLFPQGLQPFATPAAPVPPARGVQFRRRTGYMERVGLEPGAIIVALDGYRVENQLQYFVVRELSWEDDMVLTVYQDGAYRTIRASPGGRRFGVDMKDFKA